MHRNRKAQLLGKQPFHHSYHFYTSKSATDPRATDPQATESMWGLAAGGFSPLDPPPRPRSACLGLFIESSSESPNSSLRGPPPLAPAPTSRLHFPSPNSTPMPTSCFLSFFLHFGSQNGGQNQPTIMKKSVPIPHRVPTSFL